MSEKKSIVIKVKYPVSDSRVGGVISGPQVVTEWNKKRVLIALMGIIVLFSTLYLIFSGENSVPSGSAEPRALELSANAVEKPESNTAISGQQAQPVVKPEPAQINLQSESHSAVKVKEPKISVPPKTIVKAIDAKKTKSKQSNKNVVRAVITQQINNKEPGAEISKSILVNKESSWIYYFTELKQMKGQTVYHEWFKDNKRVSRHKLNIDADNWRTSSRKLVSASSSGQWMVKLLDQNGNLLNEKSFKVNIH